MARRSQKRVRNPTRKPDRATPSDDIVDQFNAAAAAEHAAENACGDHLDRSETAAGSALSLTSLSPRIRTLDEALDFAEVDRAVWEVDTYQITSWEMGQKVEAVVGNRKITIGSAVTPLWRIAVKLRRVVSPVIAGGVKLFTDRLAAQAKLSPGYPTLRKLRPKSDRHIAEFSLYDVHFGKLAWAPETGKNWDVHIATKVYLAAVEDMLAYWPDVNIDRIVLPVGHDLLHIDNDANTTARGTPQDVDGRLAKVFDAALAAVIYAIRRMAERAHVEVIHIPGNHDLKTSWYLAKCLECEFSKCKHVTVDAGPASRKYRRFGCNLFGYAHGDTLRVPELGSLMAAERPRDFAECSFKQWRLGHFHKRKRMNTISTDTIHNVEVVYMPSLTGTDHWHYDQGYVANRRAAEVWLSSYERGYVGHFSANARDCELAE